MSALYNLEPSPTAKVVLRTSSGDLSLELFAKQTPLACRNFIQLCLDGYYDNTIFHRLVPGFIIQGGDPSGTGAGGESSFDGGRPFQDEFHGRLKFNRRGLLGMANGGSRNDNGSQFFLTLDKTEELQNKHTLFGRVEGDTIYNLVRMADAELTEEQGSSRPMYPTKIVGTDVIVNPFEDISKRKRSLDIRNSQGSAKKTKTKGKGTASKQLLSFEDAEGEEIVSLKLRKAHPGLVDSSNIQALNAGDAKQPSTQIGSSKASISTGEPQTSNMNSYAISSSDKPSKEPRSQLSLEFLPPQQKLTQVGQLEETNTVIEELKASMKRSVPSAQEDRSRKQSALQGITPSTAIKGRKRKHNTLAPGEACTEEQRSLEAFNSFRAKLDEVDMSTHPTFRVQSSSRNLKQGPGKPESPSGELEHAVDPTGVINDETVLCDLHFVPNCQSCLKWNEESGVDDNYDQEDRNWMSHQLTFDKDRLGKDLEWKRQNELVLEVIDPFAKAKDIKEQKRRHGA